ncbi:MAG: phosphopentomutase [Pikeienuella sp.]
MRRACLIVLDSVGIGGAPDAAEYGDVGSDTLGHIADYCVETRGRALSLPNLDALGLGAACQASTGRVPPGLSSGQGCWAVGRETSFGKDTPSGHWELAGAPVDFEWGVFPEKTPCFPPDLIAQLCKEADLPGVLGQKHSNGIAIMRAFGEEHLRTGKPIVYTSTDSVFQIAAHETEFGLERLYELCLTARRLLDPMNIGRVIARPFAGDSVENFQRTMNRRDYSIPPHKETLCDRAKWTIGIGKIGDIFAQRGIDKSFKGADDMGLFDRVLTELEGGQDGDFIFANFVEFDSNYGHLRDPAGYASALERFDARVPEILDRMREGDLIVFTADHGNDPTWPGSDHTREQVPVLFAAHGLTDRAMGVAEFADVGATISAWLGLPPGKYGRALL